MIKIIKSFFLLLLIFLSVSLNGNCAKWEEDLIANQTLQQIGNKFPIVKYKTWAKHEIGGTLEEKSTDDDVIGAATFVIVPGAFTPTCTNKHIKFFAEGYNNEENLLRRKNIPTFVITRDNPDVMAAWARHLGVNNDLLRFISDPEYVLLQQLGVLEKNPRLGLIGKRSIFFVENGKIIDLHVEKSNADVCETSIEGVVSFWSTK